MRNFTFFEFVKLHWWYETNTDALILVTPLFTFQVGWIKNLAFDLKEEVLKFYFWPKFPVVEGEVIDYWLEFEKVYQEITLINVFMWKIWPWHYFQKKYLVKLKNGLGLMVSNG